MSELVEVEPLKGTVTKALAIWPSDQTVVERAVVLAVLFDHPPKETFVPGALTQFRESEFLCQFRGRRRIEEA
jgi:hypothetical protein